MTFKEVQGEILEGKHWYAFIKLKNETIRISKAVKGENYKYAQIGGLVWEVNYFDDWNILFGTGWEEIRQQELYKLHNTWEFYN